MAKYTAFKLLYYLYGPVVFTNPATASSMAASWLVNFRIRFRLIYTMWWWKSFYNSVCMHFEISHGLAKSDERFFQI